MPNIFTELYDKMKDNYEHIQRVSNATNQLVNKSFVFVKEAQANAANSKGVVWNYHEQTMRECEAEFLEKLQELEQFSTKFAKDLDRSKAQKTLADTPGFIEKRVHSLNASNDSLQRSVLERMELWQQAMEHALAYLNSKYDEKDLKQPKIQDRIGLLTYMSESIQKHLAVAQNFYDLNKQEIIDQWSPKSAPKQSAAGSTTTNYVFRRQGQDEEPAPAPAKASCFSCFCCFYKSKKQPGLSINHDKSEEAPLLDKNAKNVTLNI